jgi:hypothetical protein
MAMFWSVVILKLHILETLMEYSVLSLAINSFHNKQIKPIVLAFVYSLFV